jgi:hypothetical protein
MEMAGPQERLATLPFALLRAGCFLGRRFYLNLFARTDRNIATRFNLGTTHLLTVRWIYQFYTPWSRGC